MKVVDESVAMEQEVKKALKAVLAYETDAKGTPLAALNNLGILKEWMAKFEALAIKDARRDGDTWEAVAGVLGITRQAAHSRFRFVDERIEKGRGVLPVGKDKELPDFTG